MEQVEDGFGEALLNIYKQERKICGDFAFGMQGDDGTACYSGRVSGNWNLSDGTAGI